MESGRHSRDVGRHRLGPQVVGQRVVIRRALRGERGPSGGPALTDVLGVCTAWGGGRCVVQPETGPAVEIAVTDIVSGKPVPPRPSVRQRISAREAESHVASLWPHLEQQELGAWTLRSDPAPVGRLRRRANSCLAMGQPGLAFDEAEAAIRSFYAARQRPALAQVELDSDEERRFLAAGWAPLGSGDAHFELASLAQVRRGLHRRPSPPVVDLAETELEEDSSGIRVALGGGQAHGRASYARDWLGVHGLHVEPDHRRRGLASAVLAALVDWGAERGATTMWLHVETGNQPAIAFYESLGLTVHHTCRYLTITDR